jgi:hypothetical protein
MDGTRRRNPVTANKEHGRVTSCYKWTRDSPPASNAPSHAEKNIRPRQKETLPLGRVRGEALGRRGYLAKVRAPSRAGVGPARTTRTLMNRLGVAEDLAELAIGHVRADLVARYNKDDAWAGRSDAFTRVSDHVATLLGARAGTAVIPLRG